jgi:membrane-bound serine protease (ClpP class)
MAVIIALFVIGIILILLEVLLPGGVVGTIGAIFIIAGIIYTYYEKGAETGTITLVVVMVLGMIGFWFWLRYLPKLPIARKMFHSANAKEWHGTDSHKNQALVGKEGVTDTTLRPSGFAIIEEERIDVVSAGEMISKGTAIKVVMVEGNRIVVADLESPTANI